MATAMGRFDPKDSAPPPKAKAVSAATPGPADRPTVVTETTTRTYTTGLLPPPAGSGEQPGFEWIGSPGGGDVAPLDDDIIGYLLVGMEF